MRKIQVIFNWLIFPFGLFGQLGAAMVCLMDGDAETLKRNWKEWMWCLGLGRKP